MPPRRRRDSSTVVASFPSCSASAPMLCQAATANTTWIAMISLSAPARRLVRPSLSAPTCVHQQRGDGRERLGNSGSGSLGRHSSSSSATKTPTKPGNPPTSLVYYAQPTRRGAAAAAATPARRSGRRVPLVLVSSGSGRGPRGRAGASLRLRASGHPRQGLRRLPTQRRRRRRAALRPARPRLPGAASRFLDRALLLELAACVLIEDGECGVPPLCLLCRCCAGEAPRR